jgi:hypothetical protein
MSTCNTCKYFMHEDGPYGQCHWQPPAPVWARVSPRDWCGQWAQRPMPVTPATPLPDAPGIKRGRAVLTQQSRGA